MRYILLIIIITLAGCYTPRRSAQQVNKAVANYPGQTAAILRNRWPCDTTGTDTTYLPADVEGYNQAIQELNNVINSLASYNDSLASALAADTNCAEYARSLAKSNDVITKIKLIHAPPDTILITNRVKDMAEVTACNETNRLLLAQLGGKDSDIEGLKKWRTAAWIMGAAWLLFIIGYVVRWFYGRK